MYNYPNLTETDEFFRIYFPNYEKLEPLWKHLLHVIKYSTYFRENYEYQIRIFMFDTVQAQINSVQLNYSNVSNVFLIAFLQNIQKNL